jgi:hypothetical protein
MSALPPKADMCVALAYVCFGPIADMTHLFDHLVSACKQTGCYGNSERFEEIADYLEFGRLHGQKKPMQTFLRSLLTGN